MPLVSFCVPTYRRAAFLARTLSSALAQTVTDFEIVVVDDCSPDDTAAVVRGFTDPRLRYVLNEKNLGVPENLNRAMSLATGEFLVLLEDHDLMEPTYLEKTLEVMRRNPAVGFVATGCLTIDEEDRPLERYVEDLPEAMPGRALLRRLLTRTDCPFSVTAVIRRTAMNGLEPLFDSRYWWYADQYLWIRLAAKTDFGYVARPLLKFRTRESGHYLSDRFWESALVLDRIHRENWRLLYPDGGVRSRWDRMRYEKAKVWTAVLVRGGKMLRNDPWTEEDERSSRAYLSPIGRFLLDGAGRVPLRLAVRLRNVYAARHRARTRTGPA
jgi:glycosyltransferase involved in cell wall biosynthesis